MIRRMISAGMLFSLFFLAVSALLCENSFAFALPDTGQALCYDSSGNVIDCAGTGQDGAYDISPMSYANNGNGTVTDNITGRMWQQDDSVGNNWYQANGVYDAVHNPTSRDICKELTLGGYSDWRLPTKKELMSIMDYSLPYPGPTISAAFFPNTQSLGYYVSTEYAGNPDYAWMEDFSWAAVMAVTNKNDSNSYVRCVRGDHSPQVFSENGDGTVTDNFTGLIWQQGEIDAMTWDSALAYCEGSTLGNHSDWRLPNIKELESITDDTRYAPAIDVSHFPGAGSSGYWSSTTSVTYPFWARYVDFNDGSVGSYNKNFTAYTRCVRGGSGTKKFVLTVATIPEDGGTISSSPAGLVCPGNTCQESFNQGTSVALTASPNAGWKFNYWDDGATNYFQNPLSVTMNADKAVTAKFSWNEKIALGPVDSTPLANRTPLILIHGNNMETENQFGWKDYLKEFRRDRDFQGRYKVYLLSWDSEQSNVYNGLAMGLVIDNLPELRNKDLTILAHSRGGIIARYFMNQYTIRNGNRHGQLGGEKVKWLVTLATPHRGSPAADPIWVEVSFDYNFSISIELFLFDLYFTDLLPPKLRVYDPQSYLNLLWDDVDNELTTQAVCYNPAINGEAEQCTPLMSKTVLNDLSKFNQNERYFNKIIAYGGNNYSMGLDKVVTLMLGIDPGMILILSDHQKLGVTTVLMERIPLIPPGDTRVPNNPQLLFKANDGMIPLASALFLKHDTSSLFQFNKNKFTYDRTLLNNSFCQIAECNVMDGKIDHQSFLDDSKVISTILRKLDNLR